MTILTHNSHDEEARRLRAEIDAGPDPLSPDRWTEEDPLSSDRWTDWLDNTSAERAVEDVQPWQLDEQVTP